MRCKKAHFLHNIAQNFVMKLQRVHNAVRHFELLMVSTANRSDSQQTRFLNALNCMTRFDDFVENATKLDVESVTLNSSQ